MLGALFAAPPAAPQVHYLWPCNLGAWALWQDVQTQWRAGMQGATGLDYAGVRALLEETGPAPGEERRHAFECIRAAERAVLEVWAERKT